MPDVTASGYVTHYELDDFTAPWRMAETILIQHGMGRSSRHWYHWVPALAGDYRVIRRDLRGHGQSGDPGPNYEWTLDALLDDLTAFLDALELERVHLVAESTSGMLGVAFAVRSANRLGSLTLCASPTALGPSAQRFFAFGHASWQAALRTLGSEGWARELASRGGTLPEGEPGYREWALREFGKTPTHVLEGYSRLVSVLDVAPLLPQVTVPTLVLAPTHSAATPLSEQLAIWESIPGAAIAVIDAPSHEIYVDEPAQCTQALRRFLGSLVRE
jgi:pimeloyl-ACP methyl ester carboxylesterase